MNKNGIGIEESIGKFQRIIFSYSAQEFLELAKSFGIEITLPPPSINLIKPFPTIETEMISILEKMDNRKRENFINRLEKISRE